MADTIYVYFMIFLFGISIGSFLNVCIHRLPKGESIVNIPSHCVNCGKKIKFYDLIPVISYLILGGKCRSCKSKISIRYVLVELLTGLLLMFLFYNLGFSLRFYFIALLSFILILISFIDFEHMVIPDGCVIFLLVTGILYNIFRWNLSFTVSSVTGFFAASVFLYILGFLSKGGMGGGDIKLMAVCGLFLGWKNILLSVFSGAVIACFILIIQLIFKKRKEGKHIPFGPYLSMGIIISEIYGNNIIQLYLSLFF